MLFQTNLFAVPPRVKKINLEKMVALDLVFLFSLDYKKLLQNY